MDVVDQEKWENKSATCWKTPNWTNCLSHLIFDSSDCLPLFLSLSIFIYSHTLHFYSIFDFSLSLSACVRVRCSALTNGSPPAQKRRSFAETKDFASNGGTTQGRAQRSGALGRGPAVPSRRGLWLAHAPLQPPAPQRPPHERGRRPREYWPRKLGSLLDRMATKFCFSRYPNVCEEA
jgi:hypothetical protein